MHRVGVPVCSHCFVTHNAIGAGVLLNLLQQVKLSKFHRCVYDDIALETGSVPSLYGGRMVWAGYRSRQSLQTHPNRCSVIME